MLPSIVTRAYVPKSIEEVTSIEVDNEVDPLAVGIEPEAVERVWAAVERFYRDGLNPAIQLCIRCRGEVLIDRAIGYARGAAPWDAPDAEKIPITTQAPVNTFSASKAITAMVIHLLDDEGYLHLDDPVCEYIPEFSAHGKRWITIRHILTHRAGIPNIPPEAMDLDVL